MTYSIIIPVFNEELAIKKTITDLSFFLKDKLVDYEIIAINDGSTDNTKDILKNLDLRNYKFYSNPYNKGYSASLKLGAKKSEGKFIIFFDGDGQHNPEDLIKLTKETEKYDMVIGARQGYKGPALRQPGKKLITLIASYLVDFKIPDINSGLRIIKKDKFFKFFHLYPEKFSITTTSTLAFIKHGFNVKFIPITINKREGKSTVRMKDGFKAINLIFRMIMLFSPLKIFLPASAIFFLATIASFLASLFIYRELNISDTTLIFFITSVMLFAIGLLADQIASLRRETKL